VKAKFRCQNSTTELPDTVTLLRGEGKREKKKVGARFQQKKRGRVMGWGGVNGLDKWTGGTGGLGNIQRTQVRKKRSSPSLIRGYADCDHHPKRHGRKGELEGDNTGGSRKMLRIKVC